MLKNGREPTTALTLKYPKTESSIRALYIEETTVNTLHEAKAQQEQDKPELGDEYQDYGLVLAQKNGRLLEAHVIAKYLKQLIKENDLRPVVFHSLRHTSATVKLTLSGGNIKAVQGNTGHAVAAMVTDQYAFIQDGDRKALASTFEHQFLSALHPDDAQEHTSEMDSPNLTRVNELLKKLPDMIPVVLSILEKMIA